MDRYALSGGALLVALSTPLAAQNWLELLPANSPGPLSAHAMAYDIANGETVLFAGSASGTYVNTTWLFDGTDWTQAAPANSPPARVAHPMAYDMARGKVVLYGGIPVGGGLLGDTWEWDGTDWTQMMPATQPGARRSHPMIYHPGRGTVVMHGGYGTTGDSNDTWEWNGTDWSQIVTANAPTPRRASDMAYDPNGNGIVLFSGYPGAPQDTWYFNNTDWVQLTTANLPPGRWDHMMTTDPIRGRVVMFGGVTPGDTWEFDGTDWIAMSPATMPPGRLDGYLVYDLARGQVMLYGGSQWADTWAYQTPPQPGFATAIPYGVGCQSQAESVYEEFGPTAFDLSDSTIQFLPAPSGYAMLYTAGPPLWYTPQTQPLISGDEVVNGPLPLGFTLNFPGGTTSDIYISSNGFVTGGPTASEYRNATNYTLMFAGSPRWSPAWSDLDPSAGGSVYFDIDPLTNNAIVTFDNVPEWSGVGSSYTFQVVFQPSGIVEMRYQTCTSVNRYTATGFSPGNGVGDPGSIDISGLLVPVITGPFKAPIWQRANLRPVIGNTVTLTTGGLPTGTVFAANVFGLTEYFPGIDLTSIGMPGCFQYVSVDAASVIIPSGGMASSTFSVPNASIVAGIEVKTQGAALVPGYNAGNALTSNAIKLIIDLN